MNKDTLFLNYDTQEPFTFNKDVASVFDDMLKRSIPYYLDIQTMILAFISDFYKPGTSLYDLGCSTGNTYAQIIEKIGQNELNYVGVDYSADMLDRFREKFREKEGLTLISHDLNEDFTFSDPSVIIINLTLQFLDSDSRIKLLKNAYDALSEGGIVIIIEKLKMNNETLDSFYTQKYYEFKQDMGYSVEEIENKRKSLETVLNPYTYDENIALFEQAGFSNTESFFRWYNFAGFVVIR